MSDAPERIWAARSRKTDATMWWPDNSGDIGTEYVRADRIKELEAKLAVAVEFISNLKQYAVAIDDRHLHGKALDTLAELTGGKKDGTV